MFSGWDECWLCLSFVTCMIADYVQVLWCVWSYLVMLTVHIGALSRPKHIKTSIIFSGNTQSFRGLCSLSPHQGLAPGPHRGPKVGPWTPPAMGFVPRCLPYQIFSQFLYNFGRVNFTSWLRPWSKVCVVSDHPILFKFCQLAVKNSKKLQVIFWTSTLSNSNGIWKSLNAKSV